MLHTLRFAYRADRLEAISRRRPEQVRALGQARWRQLLHHAHAHSPFYRRRLRGLDLDRCRLGDLPPLTKAEMMANFDDLVTDRRVTRAGVERFIADPANLGEFFLGKYAVCHTSGSQGQPALVVQGRQDVLLGIQAQVARGQVLPRVPKVLLALQRLVRPSRAAIITQKPGFYPSGSVFAYLAAARLPALELLRLSVFAPLPEVVARLNDFQPNFLTAYTSGLETLAREQQGGRLALRRLEGLTNVSEPLPPSSRAFIEKTFGVRVSDHYALAECMALTSGCPYYPGSHVNSDLALLEVVDDDYRPVPDGVPGTRVLISNLYNRVQPFIRYEVADVVTLSPTPCPCGSPFPLVQSVGGRTKERFWVEVNGKPHEIPYYLFLAALHHCTMMAEHQVLQTGRNTFVVRATPLPGKTLSADTVRRLVRQSVQAEGLDGLLNVEVQVVAEIPRDPGSGKIQRAQNLYGPPPGPHGSEGEVTRQGVFQGA